MSRFLVLCHRGVIFAVLTAAFIAQGKASYHSAAVHFDADIRPILLGENRPGSQANTGRDHHPFAFTVFMAGGGTKGGTIDGETDEIGWNIVKDPVHVNDFHATLLHAFGLDHLRLTHRFQDRDFRLTDVAGRVIHDWIA